MSWLLILPVTTALFANLPDGAVVAPSIEPPGAQPSNPPRAVAAPQSESRWYGGPALAIDAAVAIGLATVVHLSETDSQRGPPDVIYGLAAAYLLAGPVVHLVRGHRVRSAESLLVRVGALAAGLAATFALADSTGCNDEPSEHAPCRAPYALVLSPVAAILIDDLLLAREPTARPPTTVSPRVLVQPGLALLGIGGRF